MSLQAVLFDFGGTLDSNGAAWIERFYPLYIKHGVRTAREDFSRAFYASDDGLPSRFPMPGLGLEETVSLQVRCVLEALAPDRPSLAGPIAREFVEDSRAALRGNVPLLERLGARFPLGVVSNFYGNLESVLAGEGLRGLFAAVVDSETVGRMKPDPSIFQCALRALGAEPARALMVGDSLARDMKGAEACGMPHAWLRGGSRAGPCCADAGVLERLEDLETLLAPRDAAPLR